MKHVTLTHLRVVTFIAVAFFSLRCARSYAGVTLLNEITFCWINLMGVFGIRVSDEKILRCDGQKY